MEMIQPSTLVDRAYGDRRKSPGRRKSDPPVADAVYPVITLDGGERMVNVEHLPEFLRSSLPTRYSMDEAADVIESLHKKIVTLRSAVVMCEIEFRDGCQRRNVPSFLGRLQETMSTILNRLQLNSKGADDAS